MSNSYVQTRDANRKLEDKKINNKRYLKEYLSK